MYPHRVMCDVLEEMRKTYETRNFASLLGLVEEAQAMANRMEAGLEYGRDIDALHKERKELNTEVKKLREEIKTQKEIAALGPAPSEA